MSTTSARRCALSLLVLAASTLLSCSEDDEITETTTPVSELLALPCDDALDSVYEAQMMPADWGSQMRGDLTECAFERVLTVEEMAGAFTVEGSFIDPGLSTPVHKYRLQYWTERNEGQPILTSAVLYIPETRRADPSPLLVLGHGSVGVADQCAPSLEGPDGFDKDWRVLAYTYAADGFVTIMPDLAGLGTPGTHAWLYSLDEAHATLDATRAARKLFVEGALTDKNALVGMSVGGHAVLSAQAHAADYGFEGSLDSVVVLNPIWVTAGVWGGLISTLGAALLDSTMMSLTMQYFMGHLSVYEGEDAALDAFIPEKREQVRQMMESGCWTEITKEKQGPPSIGVFVGSDVYLPEYVEEVGTCGLQDICETELAKTWRERFVVDRPAPDPSIPIIHWTGALDDFMTPDFQKCGLDRLLAQGADLSTCVERESDHAGIVPRSAAWVRQHLDQVLLGGEPPEPCESLDAFDPMLECGIPIIPNSLDPADP